LLAIFFFIVGLELKREIVTGELRKPATAIVPVVAAAGGVAVPALIYLVINLNREGGAPGGWPVPTATDIAFAVAVLAVVGRGLPLALRAFLLTLAVVDDLIGILLIALIFTSEISFLALGLSLLGVVAFGVLLKRRITTGWLLVPLGVSVWVLMHASGIHATIAGVLLGLSAPAIVERGRRESEAERLEKLWRPVSAGFAVPVFALMSAGVPVNREVLAAAVADPAASAIFVALVVGKPVGIVTATWLVSRFERVELSPGVGWGDIVGIGALAGMGFTVALLMAELAFGVDGARDDLAKAAILIASVVAATVGGGILAARGRHHTRHRDVAEPAEPVGALGGPV
jgi:NhaA family Na+:H+ antiporter